MQGLLDVASPVRLRDASLIPMLILSSSAAELARVLHNYRHQEYMFLALNVAPSDVMVQCRLTSVGDLMFRWDAAPLVGLLTPQEVQLILGDTEAVQSWLKTHRQPPTDLSSPRALADLLLNPPLLAETLRESVPWKWAAIQRSQAFKARKKTPFDAARRYEVEVWDRRAAVSGTQTAPDDLFSRFREEARQFLNDPRTRAEFNQLRRRLPDPWRLRRFVLTDSQ